MLYKLYERSASRHPLVRGRPNPPRRFPLRKPGRLDSCRASSFFPIIFYGLHVSRESSHSLMPGLPRRTNELRNGGEETDDDS